MTLITEDPSTTAATFSRSTSPTTPYPLLRSSNYYLGQGQSMVGYIPVYVQQNLNEVSIRMFLTNLMATNYEVVFFSLGRM